MVSLNPRDARPLYLQILDEVRRALVLGTLRPDPRCGSSLKQGAEPGLEEESPAFAATVFTPGALCPGSTSANPIRSLGLLPRIRHMRNSIGTLGSTPPRSMRPYTSGAMPMPPAAFA